VFGIVAYKYAYTCIRGELPLRKIERQHKGWRGMGGSPSGRHCEPNELRFGDRRTCAGALLLRAGESNC